MPNAVVADNGLNVFMQKFLQTSQLEFSLFVNDVFPNRFMNQIDFNQAAWPGYVPISFPGSAMTGPVPAGNGYMYDHGNISWNNGDVVAHQAFGYFVTTGALGLLWAMRFSPGLFLVQPGGMWTTRAIIGDVSMFQS